MAFQERWPEATVVYEQGLPTATPNDPQGKLNGWNTFDSNSSNRDLLYFDTLLKTVAQRYQYGPH